MKNKINLFLNLIIICLFISLFLEIVYIGLHLRINDSNSEIIINNSNNPKIINESNEIINDSEIILPESYILDIPFVTQAPFRSWEEYPFNHTCEEASILQVHYYLANKIVEENQVKQDLLDMVDFELNNYGFHEDTSADETARLIRDYYGYTANVYYDISLDDIKREIANGNPIIVPTAGRLLNNPHFTPPGPLYHMIVIKGYTPNEFITNDPGTYKSGEDWPYSYNILLNSIHDWNDGDVLNGKSAMISITL